ncbi:CopG family transcriptional regulator [Escherichia coli]|uniref:CopG family transcriptional regulator n=1 Tax=Escherichia coli TaxID=562 RepID=UPI00214EEF48|nr:CopG family transcriptional regulator [Escherichia coli]
MALDLKTPVIPGQKTKEQTNADTARFINEATRKKSGATKVTNVRLGDVYEDILEREALRTGQTKTAIMKAALAPQNAAVSASASEFTPSWCIAAGRGAVLRV